MALVLVACLILGGFIHVSDSLCLEVEQRAMTDPTAKECKPNNRSAFYCYVGHSIQRPSQGKLFTSVVLPKLACSANFYF